MRIGDKRSLEGGQIRHVHGLIAPGQVRTCQFPLEYLHHDAAQRGRVRPDNRVAIDKADVGNGALGNGAVRPDDAILSLESHPSCVLVSVPGRFATSNWKRQIE